MVTSENTALDRLRGVHPAPARAKQSQQWIERAEAALRQVRDLRDEAIRQAKPGHTIDELATIIGVKRNVIVDAARVKRSTNG